MLIRTPPLALCRIEPEKNVARFYALSVERDLFGRVVLVWEWGRIGTDGRRRHDEHRTEAEAFAALATIGRSGGVGTGSDHPNTTTSEHDSWSWGGSRAGAIPPVSMGAPGAPGRPPP